MNKKRWLTYEERWNLGYVDSYAEQAKDNTKRLHWHLRKLAHAISPWQVGDILEEIDSNHLDGFRIKIVEIGTPERKGLFGSYKITEWFGVHVRKDGSTASAADHLLHIDDDRKWKLLEVEK